MTYSQQVDPDPKVFPDQWVPLVLTVPPELLESLDNQDPPDPRERLVTPVSLELKVSV